MKYSIELIRIIAVVLITFTHTRHNFESGFFYTLIEVLPTYGTAILSIVSGYLYWDVSRKHKGLFMGKVRSLAVPYLISNGLVLVLSLSCYLFFDYNPLNRLAVDYSLITEGLLSLNSPPINPPTYFIRDIFVLFVVIELFVNRNLWMLFILVPLCWFGNVFLRLDVVILFVLGSFFSAFKHKVDKRWLLLFILTLCMTSFFLFAAYLKFFVAFLIFIIVVDLNFKFVKTGRYSYLLHLYHSPIMVVTYPLLSLFVSNAVLSVVLQILVSFLVVFVFYLLSKKYSILRILSGGR